MEADFPWDGLGLGCGLLGDAPMGIRLLLSYVGSSDDQIQGTWDSDCWPNALLVEFDLVNFALTLYVTDLQSKID